MAKIVIIGAGIGGMPMALEMKENARKQDEVVVIADTPTFHFVPSNPWVAVNWRKPEDIKIDSRARDEDRAVWLHQPCLDVFGPVLLILEDDAHIRAIRAEPEQRPHDGPPQPRAGSDGERKCAHAGNGVHHPRNADATRGERAEHYWLHCDVVHDVGGDAAVQAYEAPRQRQITP